MKIYIHSLTTNYIFVVVVPVQGSLVVAPEKALLPWVSSSPSPSPSTLSSSSTSASSLLFSLGVSSRDSHLVDSTLCGSSSPYSPVRLATTLTILLIICLFVCLFVCLFICLFIYLFVFLFICLFIYLLASSVGHNLDDKKDDGDDHALLATTLTTI